VGKPDLDVAARQCAVSRVAPHPQLTGKHQTSVVPRLPYSPDVAPADFFLFPKPKTALKGRRFQTIDEILEHAIRELRAITENEHSNNERHVGNGVS
jgi:hypothetical protein